MGVLSLSIEQPDVGKEGLVRMLTFTYQLLRWPTWILGHMRALISHAVQL